MSELRKASELALEAMNSMSNTLYGITTPKEREALDALRRALREDEVSRLIQERDSLIRENEHLKDSLSFYATDEHPRGWVAIHALQFAGTDRYIFQESAKESRDEID